MNFLIILIIAFQIGIVACDESKVAEDQTDPVQFTLAEDDCCNEFCQCNCCSFVSVCFGDVVMSVYDDVHIFRTDKLIKNSCEFKKIPWQPPKHFS